MLKAVKKALDKAMSVSPPEEVLGLIKQGALVLDVRTPEEAKEGIAPGAKNIPLPELENHLNELPHDRTIVTYCIRGGRAAKAKHLLEANGFKAVNGGGYAAIRKILTGDL